MKPTHLIFLDHMDRYASDAEVVSVYEENGSWVVILNKTIFYPQGGGQPFDQGTISSDEGEFVVTGTRWQDGVVKHIGTFKSGALREGDRVQCRLDTPRRVLNSRIHSAGHVLDMAVSLTNLGWEPTKGYHFPDNPYVEYRGQIDENYRTTLGSELEKQCNAFIMKGLATRIQYMSRDRAEEHFDLKLQHLPSDKPVRVVYFGDFGIPCGGTHVNKLSEIKSLSIKKIKGIETIRVSYDVKR